MSETLRKRNAGKYLDWLIDWLRQNRAPLPALGGGLVLRGNVVCTGIRGVRRHGGPTPVQPTDRFQLGSITKPMTGFLIARLRRQGLISWNRTVGETWPAMIDALPGRIPPDNESWVAHYRDASIVDLMTHTSGFDYAPSTETDAKFAVAGSTPHLQLAAKRRIYIELALLDQPYHGWSSMKGAPPQKYGGGCIIAAAMAESVLAKPWEQLIVEQVFAPLGVTNVALAAASSESSVTDLWQHRIDGGTVESSAWPDKRHISYTHGPAGAVSLSMADLGKWAAALLASTDSGYMTKAVLDEYFGLPGSDYNCTRGGWFGDGTYLSHSGDNGWNYALMTVHRGKRVAAFAATNMRSDVSPGAVGDLVAELEALADAWEGLEHLHEAAKAAEVSVTADSVADSSGNYHPPLMNDTWFRTRWMSATTTPTITATLTSARWLKGAVICQSLEPRINQFEIEVTSGDAAATPTLIAGAALEAVTTRDRLIIRVLFAEPMKAKKLVLRVKSASGAPSVSRLLLLQYDVTAATDFDIASDGRLWLLDADRRVLTTTMALSAKALVMDTEPGGTARSVRKAAGKPWLIGDDGKLYRGETNGWFPVTGSPSLLRIAVDAQDDDVWVIDGSSVIRRYHGGAWIQPPGGGMGKDICIRNGKAWVVGMDDAPYRSVTTGWVRLTGPSPVLKRIAVDDASGTLWALSADGRIHSRATNEPSWTEHPGGGIAREIAVHAGVPYVIGTNDGIWRSAGPAGWKPLVVLQPRV